jgi:hypothetical protein
MRRHWIGGLVVATLLAGCNDPAHKRAVAMREDNLRRTTDILIENEEKRPELLAGTVHMLEQRCQEDVQKTTKDNPEKVSKFFADDCKHWHDQQPEYRKEIDRQLRGSPEGIKKRLPDVIY